MKTNTILVIANGLCVPLNAGFYMTSGGTLSLVATIVSAAATIFCGYVAYRDHRRGYDIHGGRS